MIKKLGIVGLIDRNETGFIMGVVVILAANNFLAVEVFETTALSALPAARVPMVSTSSGSVTSHKRVLGDGLSISMYDLLEPFT